MNNLNIPEGWRLVPVEFTEEMMEAGKTAHVIAEDQGQREWHLGKRGMALRANRAKFIFEAICKAAPSYKEQ